MTSELKNKEPVVSRRVFLGKMAAGISCAAGASVLTYFSYSNDPVRHPPEKIYDLPEFTSEMALKISPRMVIVHGHDPYKMVKAAVDRLGGIEKFIKPGEKVVIKPNVAWDRQPEQAANTNPLVVAAVARLVREARPAHVTVTDVSLNDPFRCFKRSGIEDAARDAGADIWIPGQDDFKLTDLRGDLLKVWPVSRAFLEADRVINVPIVKHHSLCKATLAQKNWYGIIGGQRNLLHQDIHTSIADLSRAVKPTLTVMDATRVLMRNGPTGGSLTDVKVYNTIIVGLDEVAIDAYSMGLLGADPYELGYMKMSQERGLGQIDWKSVQHAEITV